MIFYFTGTGNSRWAATETARLQNEKLIFIPDAIDKEQYTYTLGEEEKIGFVFPATPDNISFLSAYAETIQVSPVIFFVSIYAEKTGNAKPDFHLPCRIIIFS